MSTFVEWEFTIFRKNVRLIQIIPTNCIYHFQNNMTFVFKMILCRTTYGSNTHYMPLHTQAKSRDWEILRAQMKVSKGRPNTLQNHVMWSRALKRSVKSCTTGPLNQKLFRFIFYSCRSSHMIKYIKPTIVSV